jgi:hypothetical protein
MLTVKVLSPEKTELDMADGVNGPAGNSSVSVTGEEGRMGSDIEN